MERTKVRRVSKFKQKGIKFKQFSLFLEVAHFAEAILKACYPAQCKVFFFEFIYRTPISSVGSTHGIFF